VSETAHVLFDNLFLFQAIGSELFTFLTEGDPKGSFGRRDTSEHHIDVTGSGVGVVSVAVVLSLSMAAVLQLRRFFCS
jgi:hypothetical protein